MVHVPLSKGSEEKTPFDTPFSENCLPLKFVRSDLYFLTKEPKRSLISHFNVQFLNRNKVLIDLFTANFEKIDDTDSFSKCGEK